MSQSSPDTIHFSPFHLSSDVDLLYCNDAVVPLEPRAVRVLRYLAEHHERVIPKEELLEQVWADVFTTDGVLKRAVLQARRALGDEAENARFIKTYHARGYRFIAPVTFSATGAGPATAPDIAHGSNATSEIGQDIPRAPFKTSAPIPTEQRESVRRDAAGDPDYEQLVGREVEFQALRAEYRDTLEGRGRPVLLVGEPGIGKTQLARHFGDWVQQQGALRFYARFFDYGGSRLAPYEFFLDFLRTAFGIVGTGQRSNLELQTLAREHCGVMLPEELFAESAGPTVSPQVRAGASSGDNFRAVVPISKCFMCLSRLRPLVLVFDDLQWADDASRDMIGYLMRISQGEPLMIVALTRTEETTLPGHPLAQWLKRQALYRSYISLTLAPLDEHACRLAIEAVFGGSVSSLDIPAHDLRTLYRVTGGNPYFLTEMLRLLVAEGTISHHRTPEKVSAWQWHGIKDLHLPETIVMAARAKLDRLSAEVREIAEHAAVIGDEFRVETLSLMAGREDEEIERLLDEGVRRGVLSERGLSAGEDCRFYHTILRRVLYDELSPRQRERLHARAARALEIVYAREADRIAEAASVHWEVAGDPRRTFEWSIRAWSAASSRWHWNEALTSIERAHRAACELDRQGEPLAPAERLKLLLGMGEGYSSVGRLKESESILLTAVALAESLSDEAAIAAALLQQGQTRIGLSLYREAKASLEEALAIYRRIEDREGVALVLVQLSSVQVAMGDYDTTAQLIEQALAGISADSHIAATAFGILGWAHALQGRYAEGVPLLERALAYHTRVGDIRRRALLLRRLHWTELSCGHYERAIELAQRAHEEFRSVGDINGGAKTNMSIGQARLAQGLETEGIAFLNRTRESLQVIGDAHCEAETLWLLGRAHCQAGRNEQAAPLLEQSLKMIQSIGDRDDEFRVLTDMARSQILAEDYQSGLRVAGDAVRIAEDLHNRDGLGAALVERARAHFGLKQWSKALEAAERAVRLLDETMSGDRWRGYWTLALILQALNGDKHSANEERALAALRRAVELLEEIREQLDPSDVERRTTLTRARSEPARDLCAMLMRLGQTTEARTVAQKWLLDEAEINTSRLRPARMPKVK